jgi:Ca-activated chloride channel family protein
MRNNPGSYQEEDGYRIETGGASSEQQAESTGEHLTLGFVPSQQSYAVSNTEKIIYLLLSIDTSHNNRDSTLKPVNVCLVLDQSSSMRGEKLFSVKAAAKQVVDQLTVNDFFSLVTFNDRATTVVTCQKVSSRENIKSMIDSIDARGGTELAQGLGRGIAEMKPAAQFTDLSYLLLLTDGQTYGDADQCVYLGMEASRNRIVVQPMGIGTDWNEDLLESVAAKTGGTSEFIETPDQIVKFFVSKVTQLRATLTNDAILGFHGMPGVKLRGAYRAYPNINELEMIGDLQGSNSQVKLGALSRNMSYKVLLEILVPSGRIGAVRLADLSIQYTPIDEGQHTQSVKLPVGINFVEANRQVPINPEVKTVIEKITTYRLQIKAWQDLNNGDLENGKKKLTAVGTRLLSMGEVELASQVRDEVDNLERRGNTSSEGAKRIKYGTRGLAGTE